MISRAWSKNVILRQCSHAYWEFLDFLNNISGPGNWKVLESAWVCSWKVLEIIWGSCKVLVLVVEINQYASYAYNTHTHTHTPCVNICIIKTELFCFTRVHNAVHRCCNLLKTWKTKRQTEIGPAGFRLVHSAYFLCTSLHGWHDWLSGWSVVAGALALW